MKTVDAVYALKDDTGESNWELRYSLRSLERYVRSIRNLVFVTNILPPFVDPEKVVHIEETDRENTKDQSIFRKVLTACQSDLVSDPFLFLNDDHFFLREADAATMPNYYHADKWLHDSRSLSSYSRRLKNTSKALTAAGYGDRHYDIHFPILYGKKKFIEMAESFPWRRGMGFVVKSLYANFHALEGEGETDCKISRILPEVEIRRLAQGRLVFSTGDRAKTSGMIAVLDEFCGSTPSRWEKNHL